jgi:hypothetical protein
VIKNPKFKILQPDIIVYLPEQSWTLDLYLYNIPYEVKKRGSEGCSTILSSFNIELEYKLYLQSKLMMEKAQEMPR